LADFQPFRGLRFTGRAGSLDNLIAPPYDVISPDRQRALYDRSPSNIVRIEFGETRPSDSDQDNRYTRASADFGEWLERGVIAEDETPAFYVYQQEFEREGRKYSRTGVFGAVRLEPWDAGGVRPHEFTMANPKADRLHLMQAVRANISPVFGLVRDQLGVVAETIKAAVTAAPVAQATDDLGLQHRLWSITDMEAVRRLSDAVALESIYIADGHHRYETALAYRDSLGRIPGEHAANFVLMALVPVSDPGLLILPIHRLVTPAREPASLADELREPWRLDGVEVAADEGGLATMLGRLEAHGRDGTAFALVRPGSLALLLLQTPGMIDGRMPAGTPPSWRALDVNRLQYGILEPIFGIGAEQLASGEYVRFTEDAREAMREVEERRGGLAFLMNPTRVTDVLDVADSGARMPQKSTFFYPKLGTGVVMRRLE
jgi:uncharacterized protein (DUF1015 family)